MDVGCGDGTVARFLCNKGIKVDAVDTSSEMIKRAVQKNPGPNYFLRDFSVFVEQNNRNYEAAIFTYSVISYFNFFSILDKTNKLITKNGIVLIDCFDFDRIIKEKKFKAEDTFLHDGLTIDVRRALFDEKGFCMVVEKRIFNKTSEYLVRHLVVNDAVLDKLKEKYFVEKESNNNRVLLVLSKK